jgi:hypothetical protein
VREGERYQDKTADNSVINRIILIAWTRRCLNHQKVNGFALYVRKRKKLDLQRMRSKRCPQPRARVMLGVELALHLLVSRRRAKGGFQLLLK